MKRLLVIPARHASRRFPGKPLAGIRGADGVVRPLIERTWRAARQVRGIDRVIIATDHAGIRTTCEAFGAEVMLTPQSCRNGTERCAVVAEALPEYDLVVNFQGDAPLTPPRFVETLLAAFADPDVSVATPVLAADPATHAALLADRAAGRVGGTTAVLDRTGRALYFSKEVLPHGDGAPVYLHLGVYAFRRAALLRYSELPETPLERAEGLEQLRFLENGLPVHCVPVEGGGKRFWEVNNPPDIPLVEAILAAQGTA